MAAEEFARRLWSELNAGPGADQPRGLVEARAFRFRAWVETRLPGEPQAPAESAPPPRRREDPAGRGLNIGQSLRAISEQVAIDPGSVEEHPERLPESPQARNSGWTLLILFLAPMTLAALALSFRKAPLLILAVVLLVFTFGVSWWRSRLPSVRMIGPKSGEQQRDRGSFLDVG